MIIFFIFNFYLVSQGCITVTATLLRSAGLWNFTVLNNVSIFLGLCGGGTRLLIRNLPLSSNVARGGARGPGAGPPLAKCLAPSGKIQTELAEVVILYYLPSRAVGNPSKSKRFRHFNVVQWQWCLD